MRRAGVSAVGVAVAVALVTGVAVSPANAAELVAPTVPVDASTFPIEDSAGASGDTAAIAAAAADYTPGDAGAAVALAEAASAQDAVALDSTATASLGGASVTVEDTGTAFLSLGEGTQIGVSVAGADQPVEFVDGVAVQAGVSPATDIVTRATEDGAQLVAVLGDDSAGNTVPFALDLPDNATLTPQEDGSIAVTAPVEVEKPLEGETERIEQQITAIIGDPNSTEELTPTQLSAIEALEPAATETVVEVQQIATIETPWAVDANGTALPTSYTLEGTTLTQNIDTTNATYPITADPSWVWWAGTIASCAAAVAALFFPVAKAAQALSKAGKIISSSARLTQLINKLGGLKNSLVLIKQYIVNKAKLSRNVQATVKASLSFGITMVTDALGIGSCISLIRAGA